MSHFTFTHSHLEDSYVNAPCPTMIKGKMLYGKLWKMTNDPVATARGSETLVIYQNQKSRRNPKRIWRGRIVRVGTRKESRKAWRVVTEEVGPNELKSMNSLPKLKTVLFRTLSNSATGRRRTLSVILKSRATFKSKMN